MRLSKHQLLLVCLAFMSLSACGTRTPEIVPGGGEDAPALLVQNVIAHVKCELKYAVRSAVWYDYANTRANPGEKRRIEWIDKWGAKLAIKLTIKEKSSLNPGLSLITPLRDSLKPFSTGIVRSGQNRSFGMGGSASTEATRIVNLDFYYDFASQFLGPDFNRKVAPQPCPAYQGNLFVDGDLKLKEFVDMATFPFFPPGTVSAKAPDATSQEIQFVLSFDANVTPSWKLARIATNNGALGLFDVNRTTTNDLIVTIGPAYGGVPSASLSEAHFLAKQQSNVLVAVSP